MPIVVRFLFTHAYTHKWSNLPRSTVVTEDVSEHADQFVETVLLAVTIL